MTANSENNYRQDSPPQNNKHVPEDEPITGPHYPGPEYPLEPDMERPLSTSLIVGRFLGDLVRKPVHWVRENIVEPNKGPKYYWYHRKFERALPIDECYIDDYVCIYEADQEFKRNRLVDKATLDLLRYRRDSCNFWHILNKGFTYQPHEACRDVDQTYERESINFMVKYGDMQYNANAWNAYNKQKHRMIMERRLEEARKLQ